MTIENMLKRRTIHDVEHLNKWREKCVPFCCESDIPEWVAERITRYRGGQSFHDALIDLLCVANWRFKLKISWCLVDEKIYINKDGIFDFILFINEHEYMPPWECDKWAEEMDEFFERSKDVDTD